MIGKIECVNLSYERVIKKTNKAIHFQFDNFSEWFPNSVCTFMNDNKVMVPTWILRSKNIKIEKE